MRKTFIITVGHLYGLLEACAFSVNPLNGLYIVDVNSNQPGQQIDMHDLFKHVKILQTGAELLVSEMHTEGSQPSIDDVIEDENITDLLDEVIDSCEQICHNLIVAHVPKTVFMGQQYNPSQIQKLVKEFFKFSGAIYLEDDATDDFGEWEPED